MALAFRYTSGGHWGQAGQAGLELLLLVEVEKLWFGLPRLAHFIPAAELARDWSSYSRGTVGVQARYSLPTVAQQ